VSCNTTSNEELDKITPVNPPKVNKKINPRDHNSAGSSFNNEPMIVLNHLKTLIPVGMAIIIVAAVKYARVSTSNPTVNI
jgi:hypothetical protein